MPISKTFLDSIDTNTISINLCSYYPMITDKDIKRLVAAVKVKNDTLELMLNDNGVSDEGVQAITELNKLEALSLSSNQITDSGAKSIAQMKSLISLDIAENEITDDGMSEIVNNLLNLKSLTLTSEAVGNKTVEAILNHPGLEEVLIYDDENVELEIMNQIKEHTKNNKKKNEADKNNESALISSSKLSTAFFKEANKLEDKESIESIQQELEELLEKAICALKKIPNPDQREKLRKNFIDRLLEFSLLPNSPECKD